MSILTHTMSVYLGNGRTLDDNRDNVNAMTNMWPSVTWIFSAIQFNKHYITWGLFDCASSSWNKVKCQLDATRQFYWCILSSTCFGYIRTSSGALDIELQHMVFCTEYVDGWWSWEPLFVRCGWCRAHGTIRTVHKTYAAALKTTTHPKTRSRKSYAAIYVSN